MKLGEVVSRHSVFLVDDNIPKKADVTQTDHPAP